MKKILFYGETTKYAQHGVSISNDFFIADLNRYFEMVVIEEQVKLSSYGKLGLSKIKAYLRALRKVYRALKNNQFDFFYHVLSLSLQGSIKSIGLLLFVKLLSPQTQVITHIHRGDFSAKVAAKNLLSRLLALAIRLSNKVILISKQQTEHYKDTRFMGISAYYYVANTVEPSAGLSNAVHSVSQETSSYLYLSNYIKEKGIHDLLTVWRGFDCSMNLVCYGGETPGITVNDLVLSYPLSNVTFNRSVFDDEKFKVISQSKALILPSWNEGAPLVLLEAMSLGIPVIASNVGFISEMLGYTYPFLFQARDNDSLKDVIVKFERLSRTERLELSTQLQARFHSCYSRENRVADYLEVFKS